MFAYFRRRHEAKWLARIGTVLKDHLVYEKEHSERQIENLWKSAHAEFRRRLPEDPAAYAPFQREIAVEQKIRARYWFCPKRLPELIRRAVRDA